MIEFRYDTQLLIEGTNLNEDEINDYFINNFKGYSLLAAGDEELIKSHGCCSGLELQLWLSLTLMTSKKLYRRNYGYYTTTGQSNG